MSDTASARPRASILVVEDDPGLADQLMWALRKHYEVRHVASRSAAMAALRERLPDLVLADLCLPPTHEMTEGLSILREVSALGGDVVAVAMSGLEDREAAVQAIGAGAYDFFIKPFDLPLLQTIVARALDRQALARENMRLKRELLSRSSVAGLLGTSPAMQAVADSVRRVADAPVTVLLEGESGTGKNIAARAIHFTGARRDAPFVAVHCSALPESLLEDGLFGHAKGAFTGAAEARMGRVEAADGGTLFLDEIGTISPAVQTKLLRVLEEREVQRLGSNETRRVDFRLIAATNDDLQDKVRRGEFREDLFFRVHVFAIRMPALRERREDIPLLAEFFLKDLGTSHRVQPKRFSDDALQQLAGMPWPGNVRELRNAVEQLTLLVDGDVIEAANLERITSSPRFQVAPILERVQTTDFYAAMDVCERELLEEAIRRAGGSKAGAARAVGLQPSQMKYLVQKHGLKGSKN